MRARQRSDSQQEEGNEIFEHIEKYEVLRELYNKNDVPKIGNFYKVSEAAIKKGAHKLNVYKLIVHTQLTSRR